MTSQIIGFLGFVLCANAGMFGNMAEFSKFMYDYDKKYNSLTEMMTRFRIFSLNVFTIEAYNANQTDFVLAINEFADLTQKEFKEKYLNPVLSDDWSEEDEANLQRDNYTANLTKVKERIDWRRKGKVTKVKNQNHCGACWAFSAVGAMESLHAIVKGTLLEFSEQQLVDCSGYLGNNGCSGGDVINANKFVMQRGIALAKDYPYVGKDSRCKRKKEAFKISNSGIVPRDNNDQLLKLLNMQPISVAVQADLPVFMFYKSGVITHDCGTEVNHAVLLVGSDLDADRDLPFWIIKNSWGRSWGIEGYGRIQRDTGINEGVCGIARKASYPIL